MKPSWIPGDKDVYLFDVDGVVLRACAPFSDRYESEVGQPGLLTTFFKGVFQECLVGNADLREEVTKRLEDWQWDGDADSFLEHWFSNESEPNPEIIEALTALKQEGKACYIVTNQEKYRTEYFTENLDLDALVDGLYSSSMLGVKKPHHDFFHEALKAIGFDGDLGKVFLVDNELPNVHAAQELGISTFYYEA